MVKDVHEDGGEHGCGNEDGDGGDGGVEGSDEVGVGDD